MADNTQDVFVGSEAGQLRFCKINAAFVGWPILREAMGWPPLPILVSVMNTGDVGVGGVVIGVGEKVMFFVEI